MKTMKHSSTLPLAILILSICPLTSTQALDNVMIQPEVKQEIMQGITAADRLNEVVKDTGVVKAQCVGCSEKGPNLTVSLESKDVDLGKPYYMGKKDPYVIYLKRTNKTPKSVDLNFKNGYRVCGKMFAGTNPWYPQGGLIIECAFYITQYEDHEISLNLKDLPELKEGEEEIIELNFYKEDDRQPKYSIEVNGTGQKGFTSKVEKKFWGYGYNVKCSSGK